MLGIFRKKVEAAPRIGFPIFTDMHSHILPGIDDGSPDIATSLQLVAGMKKLGITGAIATPHIIGDIYRNNSETITASLNLLKEALAENEIDFRVAAAAEYMLDDYFMGLLRNKTPLLTLKDNLVLTEFSYAERPFNAENIIFEMITEGYQPVLAHPERYIYYHNDMAQYHHLAELGFLLQVNLLSLTGYYGKPASRAAAYILKNGLASFTGTDIHHDRHLTALQHPANNELISSTFTERMNEALVF